MDISTLSLVELKDLLTQIPAEIKRREKDEKANLLKDLEKMVADRGFSLSDFMDGGGKKIKTPVAVKYQHPQDASLAWTGRGRHPKWVVEFVANGGSMDALAV